MEYEPEYAKGEIKVLFLSEYDSDEKDLLFVLLDENEGYFASAFGRYLGLELKGKHEFDEDIYIYGCAEGREDETIEKIEKFGSVIEWAERRDLKWERRFNEIEEAVKMAESLRGRCNMLPTDEYNNRLREISDYLKGIMEK